MAAGVAEPTRGDLAREASAKLGRTPFKLPVKLDRPNELGVRLCGAEGVVGVDGEAAGAALVAPKGGMSPPGAVFRSAASGPRAFLLWTLV